MLTHGGSADTEPPRVSVRADETKSPRLQSSALWSFAPGRAQELVAYAPGVPCRDSSRHSKPAAPPDPTTALAPSMRILALANTAC
jgi:hypothetical protein